MNTCTDIHYKKLITAEKDLPAAIDSLLSQICDSEEVARIVFFIDAENDDDYFAKKSIIEALTHRHFGTRMPACTVVAQPPLEGALQAEVHYFTHPAAASLRYKTTENGKPYTTLDTDGYKYLFTGGVQAASAQMPVTAQAQGAFDQLLEILKNEGMELQHIVRQWNYICQITKVDAANGQHYQQFNNVRSRYYGIADWQNGYPAATGIGTACGSVILDADAMKTTGESVKTMPIDNKLQIAAHKYSGNVLARMKEGATTPKFERARMIYHEDRELIYVSGTASIRGERTIGVGDVAEQCRCTVDNIRELTHDAAPRLCRIYLKNSSDYAAIKPLIEAEYSSAQRIYIVADVCRDDLLIEIEGVC